MRAFALALAALVTGCSPAQLWGNEARYAPDLRGYVVERSPRSGAHLVLADPVTGKKIRCREDLDVFLPPIVGARAAALHDENVVWAVTPPAGVVMAPLLMPGTLLYTGGAYSLLLPEGLYKLTSSRSAQGLYEDGIRAFREQRFDAAERLLELALLRPPDSPRSQPPVEVHRARAYLGYLYEREGRRDDAVRALRAFVERAVVRDEGAYAAAEAHLEALSPGAIAPCRSQAPLTFRWPRGS